MHYHIDVIHPMQIKKKHKRSLRRYQLQKHTDRRMRWIMTWGCISAINHAEWLKRMRYQMKSTGTLCSCYMCGNPRKWFGQKTFQEKRYEEIGGRFYF
jgi:hypothetical protein